MNLTQIGNVIDVVDKVTQKHIVMHLHTFKDIIYKYIRLCYEQSLVSYC